MKQSRSMNALHTLFVHIRVVVASKVKGKKTFLKKQKDEKGKKIEYNKEPSLNAIPGFHSH